MWDGIFSFGTFYRIMVLDCGQVVEMDSPGVLLQNKNSVFYSLAKTEGLV